MITAPSGPYRSLFRTVSTAPSGPYSFPYPLLRYLQTLNLKGNDMYIIHDMRSITLLCDESIDSYKNKK